VGLFIVLELIAFGWILSSIESFREIIHPALLLLIFIIGFSVKYFLWNKFGVEELIVNTKSISWVYDYGFFRTNTKTVKYDRLGTGFERIRGLENEELGRLVFYNYREEDNLPEFIHQTTVLLKKEEINEFDKQISNVFENEFSYKNGFIAFSEN